MLVDFWAPWCGPCKQLTPVLEKAVNAAGGKVKLVKMNIDDHPSIAGQLGIQSIPAVIAFKDGQPVDGFMGAIPESQIREFIDKVAGKGGADAGGRDRSGGRGSGSCWPPSDIDGAADIYDAVLQATRERRGDRRAGRLAVRPPASMSRRARLLADLPEELARIAGIAARVPKKLARRGSRKLGDPAEFERGLAANPDDHQARFDLAMIHNVEGERDEAADNLLAIIKARPHLGRRRRARAAAAVLRGLGHQRSGDAFGPAQVVVDAVLVTCRSTGGRR